MYDSLKVFLRVGSNTMWIFVPAFVLFNMAMHQMSAIQVDEHIQDETYVSFNDSAGVGDVLSEFLAPSKVSCCVGCSMMSTCTAANYISSNSICTLLHVQIVTEDWVLAGDVTFLAVKDSQSPPGESC